VAQHSYAQLDISNSISLTLHHLFAKGRPSSKIGVAIRQRINQNIKYPKKSGAEPSTRNTSILVFGFALSIGNPFVGLVAVYSFSMPCILVLAAFLTNKAANHKRKRLYLLIVMYTCADHDLFLFQSFNNVLLI
jgi:hypothetical protein